MTRLVNGCEVKDRRLDRLVQFDQRSRNFPVRALISAAVKPRSYTWSCDAWLDQGREGACVGFSISHEAASRPVVVRGITATIAQRVYKRAQQIDEWEGEEYDGTSVLAGIKAAQERGWYGEYRWAFGLNDLILAVGYKGPAVLGINWYEGMLEVGPKGIIRPTGDIAGGHAILCNGVSIKNRLFRLHNSWGEGWGIFGDCFISFDDMDRLLHEQGEACVPVKRNIGSGSSDTET